MRILFVASEVAPFSKTGGLGDVAGALPSALADRGHEVVVVTPRYGFVDPAAHTLTRLGSTVHARGESAVLLGTRLGNAQVYLLEHERFYGSRSAPYSDEHGSDYPDNAQRFAFLCRAALDVPRATGFEPDVVHLHDWQTALAAWMLRHEHGHQAWARRARTVYTIHNLAYQGIFPKELVPALGLPWDVFRYEAMEFYDQLNMMKAGLVFADAIATVSPSYAREILSPEHGCSLDPVLRHRARHLTGILNGIDDETWDPSRDSHLAATYSRRDISGKARCKAALQRELELPRRREVPLIAMVGRLAEQKGVDLVAAALQQMMGMEVQFVVLGSGQSDYERLFRRAERAWPQRVAVRIGFDEGLAHRIEAGADVFLMPSRFEPCGLNQMYSLRYGTVPVVRAVGGLEDSVEDFDGARNGTGFTFRDYSPAAMMTALQRALETYRDARAWRGIMERGMAEDNSWRNSAEHYERLLEALPSRHAGA
ncbi:MAG: starch synthase [Anaeromyxobacter sp. RBG_16_69_14]|nr:MAG: starch synthase [Anaeromyxobacter sp. RBG_16_69_14]